MSKKEEFIKLCEQVQNCSKCGNMKGRKKVLSVKNGDISSNVLFIAEAPGRLGAEQTGIPIYQDQTGERFAKFLGKNADKSKGWEGCGIFVTNAVLCNPQDLGGRNMKPSPEHCINCQQYLYDTIRIIDPQLIVCLGNTAVNTLLRRCPFRGENDLLIYKATKLSALVGKFFRWAGYKVYVLYHPGPQTRCWRKDDLQIEDYKKIQAFLD